jgi:hypothetical protein
VTSESCARSVLSADTPDGYPAEWGTQGLGLPSADLLERARVGWEHFTGEEPADV